MTGGLVALSRIQSHSQLLDVLDPNAIEADSTRRYSDAFVQDHVRAALRARQARHEPLETLPRRQDARAALYTAQLNAESLRRMRGYLPSEMPAEIDVRGMRASATLAVAAMRAGLCVSANFSLPVFDTHGDNDASQDRGLGVLLQDIDFAIEAAEVAGLRDRLTVVIGSDFGRTPRYNAADGKDHWSIGSAMVLGPGIRGDRVIGATDGEMNPFDLDPATLAPTREGGVRLRPEHLHHALREHAGVADTAGALRYPLTNEPLPLFT